MWIKLLSENPILFWTALGTIISLFLGIVPWVVKFVKYIFCRPTLIFLYEHKRPYFHPIELPKNPNVAKCMSAEIFNNGGAIAKNVHAEVSRIFNLDIGWDLMEAKPKPLFWSDTDERKIDIQPGRHVFLNIAFVINDPLDSFIHIFTIEPFWPENSIEFNSADAFPWNFLFEIAVYADNVKTFKRYFDVTVKNPIQPLSVQMKLRKRNLREIIQIRPSKRIKRSK